jgi:hypothetical protein
MFINNPPGIAGIPVLGGGQGIISIAQTVIFLLILPVTNSEVPHESCSMPVAYFSARQTDDPEPVDYRHVELDFFTQATRTRDEREGTAAGLDANYGIYPDVELTLVAPLAFNAPSGASTAYGYGDTEISVKYRFIDESEGHWWPQVAIYPQVNIPTGSSHRSLGTGQTAEFLPVYVQKDFDPWQVYGGAGYWNNPGVDNRNYWFFGGVVQRKVTDALTLGAELFHQTATTTLGRESSGYNLGGSYDLDEHYHILLSAGRGIEGVEDANMFSYYLALQVTY